MDTGELEQRFERAIAKERVAILPEMLKFGDNGIELLIAAMQDEELTVRATAYKLLKGVYSHKAKVEIFKGLLLNKGDRIYSVYKSSVTRDDLYYICDSLSGGPRLDNNIKDDYYPLLVSRHIFRETAETKAKLLHQARLLEINTYALDRNCSANFNIAEWCTDNHIALSQEKGEYYQQFEDRVVQYLQAAKNIELLEKFWNCLWKRRLAFVHKEIVREPTRIKPPYVTIPYIRLEIP